MFFNMKSVNCATILKNKEHALKETRMLKIELYSCTGPLTLRAPLI